MSNNPHKFQVNRLLTPSELHQFLEVNFEDGLLYWKKRDKELFTSDRSANVWNAKHAGKQAFTANHVSGYKHGLILRKPYLAHRVIYALKHGEWPNYIDHINGDRIDNRLTNLRSVIRTQNSCNARKPTINRKRKALGNFVNFDEAVACRKESQVSLGFHPNHGR